MKRTLLLALGAAIGFCQQVNPPAGGGSGGAPSGTAGGDLGSTYPNPTVVALNGASLAGLGSGLLRNATGTGVPTIISTSAGLATNISDETGSGALVFGTAPTLTTPVLGVASATTINKVTLTAPATASTLTIADGKVLTASNTLTFTGTDSSSIAFGAGGTVAYTNSTDFVKGAATLTTTGSIPIQNGTTGTVTQVSGLTFASAILSVPTIVNTTTFRGVDVLFAALATSFPNNGDSGYSSDSGPTSGSDDTCAGSGSGSWVTRIGGTYRCRQ